MIPINLAASGLLDPRALHAWKSGVKQEIHDAVKRGMQLGGRQLADRVQANVAATLKIKRRGFLKSFRPKVFDNKPGRLPALLVGSKVPWSGVHEKGAVINGKMMIPFTQTMGHPGPIAWHNFLSRLFASRQAVLRNVHGREILFARVAGIRAAIAAGAGGRAGRVRLKAGRKAGTDLVPVAIYTRQVTLKKRIDVRATVQANIGQLAAAIQTELNKV